MSYLKRQRQNCEFENSLGYKARHGGRKNIFTKLPCVCVLRVIIKGSKILEDMVCKL